MTILIFLSVTIQEMLDKKIVSISIIVLHLYSNVHFKNNKRFLEILMLCYAVIPLY